MKKEALPFPRPHLRLEKTGATGEFQSRRGVFRERTGGQCGYRKGWVRPDRVNSCALCRKAVKRRKEFRLQWPACPSSKPHSPTFWRHDSEPVAQLPLILHLYLGENNGTRRTVKSKCANARKGFRVSTYLSAQHALKLAKAAGRSHPPAALRPGPFSRAQLSRATGTPAIAMVTATYFRKKYGARRGPFRAFCPRELTVGPQRGEFSGCCGFRLPPSRPAPVFSQGRPPPQPRFRRSQLFRPGRRG